MFILSVPSLSNHMAIIPGFPAIPEPPGHPDSSPLLYPAFPCPGLCFLPFFTWLSILTFKIPTLSELRHGVMMESIMFSHS